MLVPSLLASMQLPAGPLWAGPVAVTPPVAAADDTASEAGKWPVRPEGSGPYPDRLKPGSRNTRWPVARSCGGGLGGWVGGGSGSGAGRSGVALAAIGFKAERPWLASHDAHPGALQALPFP